MNTELNFLFIGKCLGHEIEGTPKLGKLIHVILDLDWHTKVYLCDDKYYIVEEAFLDHENCKWEKNYYRALKKTFNWNIELEGNLRQLEFEVEEKPLILK